MDGEIQHDATHLTRIDVDRRKPLFRDDLQLDPLAERLGQHRFEIGEDAVQAEAHRPQHLTSRKRQQLIRQARRPHRRVVRVSSVDPLRAVLGQIVHQQLGRHQNDGEQVVEVVRHAAGEPADRLHLVRVLVDRVQLRLEVRDSRFEFLMTCRELRARSRAASAAPRHARQHVGIDRLFDAIIGTRCRTHAEHRSIHRPSAAISRTGVCRSSGSRLIAAHNSIASTPGAGSEATIRSAWISRALSIASLPSAKAGAIAFTRAANACRDGASPTMRMVAEVAAELTTG